MTPESILAGKSLILSQQAREAYFEQGYVVATGFLDQGWLQRMRDAYLAAVERSRKICDSNEWYALQTDHSRDIPRIHRVEKLPDQDAESWDVVVNSDISKLAADIVGPDVIYRDSINWDDAVTLPCCAGDAVILHPLTLHDSGPNESERSRPCLIHGMSAADAKSYTAMTWGNSHSGELIRGNPARFAHHEDMIMPLLPDWSDGYTSIFEPHRRGGFPGSDAKAERLLPGILQFRWIACTITGSHGAKRSGMCMLSRPQNASIVIDGISG